MDVTVLEESWRRNGPVGPSLEVIDDDEEFRLHYVGESCNDAFFWAEFF
jgi:hypothetical protein